MRAFIDQLHEHNDIRCFISIFALLFCAPHALHRLVAMPADCSKQLGFVTFTNLSLGVHLMLFDHMSSSIFVTFSLVVGSANAVSFFSRTGTFTSCPKVLLACSPSAFVVLSNDPTAFGHGVFARFDATVPPAVVF